MRRLWLAAFALACMPAYAAPAPMLEGWRLVGQVCSLRRCHVVRGRIGGLYGCQSRRALLAEMAPEQFRDLACEKVASSEVRV